MGGKTSNSEEFLSQSNKLTSKSLPWICYLKTTPIELTIDRIHPILKPSFLLQSVPCDILLRVHFYHIMEQILTESRSMGQLPNPYSSIQIYTDLSKNTLDLSRQLLKLSEIINIIQMETTLQALS